MKSLRIMLAGCMLAITCRAQELPDLPFTKGVYGSPGAFFEKGLSFESLGINAIFVRSVSLDESLYVAAKAQEVRVYVEFPTLNGKDYVEEHPEAWPINEKGERAPPADWFMGICLTDPGFRDYRIAQLKEILQKFQVDGIWLDYLHWHAQFETPDPILPETCFCDRCIRKFERDMSVEVPKAEATEQALWILSRADSSWRLWRSCELNDWVSDLKTVVKESQPNALLGIYYCPWYPSDYDGALYRILGIDMDALAGIVDVFSPMLYHQMMGRPSLWVAEYTAWLDNAGIRSGKKLLIWPIVQAYNKPGIISTEEFRQVMTYGSQPPATGLMMFTVQTLISDPEKLAVMKALFRRK